METDSNTTKEGLSNKIKIPIIILTFLTLCAMGVMFSKIASSVNSLERSETEKVDNYQYLRTVGDKLKINGLNEQAIDQYIEYLDKTEASALPRATVAHTVGELYMELSNCREALTWLFRAETAGPAYQRANDLKKHIYTCLTYINTAEPINLTTR